MTKSAEEYRKQLVEQVYATGLYFLKHAEKIVDLADMKVEFSISVSYEYGEVPMIEITQSHIMREVLEVINAK